MQFNTSEQDEAYEKLLAERKSSLLPQLTLQIFLIAQC